MTRSSRLPAALHHQRRSWGRGEQTIKSQPDGGRDSGATCARLSGGGGGEPEDSVGAEDASAKNPQMIHLHLITQLMTHVNNTDTPNFSSRRFLGGGVTAAARESLSDISKLHGGISHKIIFCRHH